jgi:hypothetical protein
LWEGLELLLLCEMFELSPIVTLNSLNTHFFPVRRLGKLETDETWTRDRFSWNISRVNSLNSYFYFSLSLHHYRITLIEWLNVTFKRFRNRYHHLLLLFESNVWNLSILLKTLDIREFLDNRRYTRYDGENRWR